MIDSFVRFGPAHINAIALTVAIPLLLTAIVRLDHTSATARIVNALFAATLILNKIISLVLLSRYGELTIESLVPMYLCDWAAIAVVITLVWPNQWTYELCYFWSLGGTLQALLTPDLRYGFPHTQFISFFVEHGGIIAAVVYMTLTTGMRPVPMSIVRVLGWSAVYFVAALLVNLMLDTNFGYLRAKPEQPSLMDYMAPWPYYLAQLVLLAIIFCLVCYLPFFIIDRLRSRGRVPDVRI
ncbi:MAG: TIGR02206 family membrane protein [Bradyrhizobiaceae bacterium]|nr:TIGR02206 family membrane protein [Bradyrhizobiaceae bacterium]